MDTARIQRKYYCGSKKVQMLGSNVDVIQLPPCTFQWHLAHEYKGGYWDFYTLSNGGFYMALNSDASFDVICDNQYRGNLSADALGITACLYT